MRRRVSDDKLKQELNFRINYLTGKVQEIDALEGEFDGKLWKFIEKAITKKLEHKDELLFNFKKLSPRDIDILLAEKNELIGILSLPAFIKERESLESEIDKLKDKLNGIVAGK